MCGDPQFTFTLCRVGTNKNGDHFTAEELAGRYPTAVNKKIDLQHSQEFSDIVGGDLDQLKGARHRRPMASLNGLDDALCKCDGRDRTEERHPHGGLRRVAVCEVLAKAIARLHELAHDVALDAGGIDTGLRRTRALDVGLVLRVPSSVELVEGDLPLVEIEQLILAQGPGIRCQRQLVAGLCLDVVLAASVAAKSFAAAGISSWTRSSTGSSANTANGTAPSAPMRQSTRLKPSRAKR